MMIQIPIQIPMIPIVAFLLLVITRHQGTFDDGVWAIRNPNKRRPKNKTRNDGIDKWYVDQKRETKTNETNNKYQERKKRKKKGCVCVPFTGL